MRLPAARKQKFPRGKPSNCSLQDQKRERGFGESSDNNASRLYTEKPLSSQTAGKAVEFSNDNRASVAGGGGNVGVQTALALTADDAVVALLAPHRTPRVLDDPVLLLALNTESDDGDTVVEHLGVAQEFKGVGDAARVPLHRGGVDADGKGTVLDQRCRKLVLVRAVDHCPVGDEDLLGALLRLARPI